MNITLRIQNVVFVKHCGYLNGTYLMTFCGRLGQPWAMKPVRWSRLSADSSTKMLLHCVQTFSAVHGCSRSERANQHCITSHERWFEHLRAYIFWLPTLACGCSLTLTEQTWANTGDGPSPGRILDIRCITGQSGPVRQKVVPT
jgi:hypothetical protein